MKSRRLSMFRKNIFPPQTYLIFFNIPHSVFFFIILPPKGAIAPVITKYKTKSRRATHFALSPAFISV